jgi:hypothetical protein
LGASSDACKTSKQAGWKVQSFLPECKLALIAGDTWAVRTLANGQPNAIL